MKKIVITRQETLDSAIENGIISKEEAAKLFSVRGAKKVKEELTLKEKMNEMIEIGKRIGYLEAILFYFENDKIEEEEFPLLQNTHLMILLEKELIKTRVIKSYQKKGRTMVTKILEKIKTNTK